MIGRVLAHYRITGRLGAGGQGEVYRATDTKLGREVAVKVLPEEILNALTKLPGLRVVARSSAFRFKDQARDVREMGKTLDVTTVLEGSVRTAGSRLRVTAQLVNTSDGYQLWSERFDWQSEDVFEIQDEIAAKVVEAFAGGVTREAAPRPSQRESRGVSGELSS